VAEFFDDAGVGAFAEDANTAFAAASTLLTEVATGLLCSIEE
jgi:hypothetical protein